MRVPLKEFQEVAVDELVNKMRQAIRDASVSDPQVVGFSAPTGSGKTLMLAAALDRLAVGDQEHPEPIEDLTVLWITDDPALNEQSRKQLEAASSEFSSDRLRILPSTFDEELLTSGCVSFLNTQKLGKRGTLVREAGDRKTNSFWSVVARMVSERPTSLWVVIDEAHKGMKTSKAAHDEAQSIVQRFIMGLNGKMPPVPLVFGMSATPERFDALVGETSRSQRKVVVEPSDVRRSGLLKEVVSLLHPDDDQPGDITMLEEAVEEWLRYRSQWSEYCQAEGLAVVEPILVVQVQDKIGRRVSATNLAKVVSTIDRVAGGLPERSYAHTFDTESLEEVGDRSLRYVSPSDIVDDADIRVVFFKTALNTGWDCPRAEVMVSFRTAKDATLIAQLVGRMVRTPLARRVDANEHLNSVALFLPEYDKRTLGIVVELLTKDSGEYVPPVSVQTGRSVTLRRRPDAEAVFEAAAKLPTYYVGRPRKMSHIRRLVRLASLLAADELDRDAPDVATREVVRAIAAERARLQSGAAFRRALEKHGQLDIRIVDFGYEKGSTARSRSRTVSEENIDDLFAAAGRRIGDGMHLAYWRKRCGNDPALRRRTKIEAAIILADPEAYANIEAAAESSVGKWLEKHQEAINGLGEAASQRYREVRRISAETVLETLVLREQIDVPESDQKWAHHIYVDDNGEFAHSLNSWESRVVRAELEREDVVGWLRNLARKPWSLAVPYRGVDGRPAPFYPDFLFFRSAGSQIVVDILDPHLPSISDAPRKAVGLAAFVEKHGHFFGRVELISLAGDKLRRLDLKDEQVRKRVLRIDSGQHLVDLYESLG